MMDHDEIRRRIAEHRTEIERLGVDRLSLFGSHARGDAGEDSDFDFLVSFRQKSYSNYFDLKELLQDVFGRRVDLVTREALKPALRDEILSEAIDATPN